MPTNRPRHSITETDDVAAALDAAARLWPDADRRELARRVFEEGVKAVLRQSSRGMEIRKAAIRKYAGAFPGASEEYRRSREDWPG